MDNEKNNEQIAFSFCNYKDGTIYRNCPKCNKDLPIESFGFRDNGGVIMIQSWCTACRNGK